MHCFIIFVQARCHTDVKSGKCIELCYQTVFVILYLHDKWEYSSSEVIML